MTSALPDVGDYVMINGGFASTPDLSEAGPIHPELEGALGRIVDYKSPKGISFRFGGCYPDAQFNEYAAIEVLSGKQSGSLLSLDMLEFTVLSPLEVLAFQVDP